MTEFPTRRRADLIRTKFHRPPVPRRAVERPHLFRKLDVATGRPLTVISAGPGFGKTTVAAQWLETRAHRSCWLSLDSLDNEPERFLRYFVAALKELLPGGFEKTEALLRSRTVPPWPYCIEVLASELAEPAEPSLLVLDDCQMLSSEPIHDLMERVVEVLPTTLRLLVLTRIDPPWPLGRWRARAQLSELRSSELRFTLDETRSYFALREELALDADTVEMVHRRTEGWIAALQLAEVSMAGTDSPRERAWRLSGSDRNIADFLMEEVLAGQPNHVREFLAVAARFDKFCAELCDHVLANGDQRARSREVIADLETRNLFLVPLDPDRKWYRFHHLFQEFIKQQADELAASHILDQVDRRAAEWYAERGMVELALRHWVAAGDLDTAADLVGKHVDFVVRADLSRQTLNRWLALFPADAQDNRLELLVARGCKQIIHWNLSGLAELLQRADALGSESNPAHRATLEVLRCFLLYWRGDVEGAMASAGKALSGNPPIGGVTWSLGTMYLAAGLARVGRTAQALEMLDDAMTEAARQGHFAAEFIGVQGILQLYAQEYDSVRQRGLQLLTAHEREPVPEYWLGHAYYLLGCEAYERNRLQEAHEWFEKVVALRYLITSRLYEDALIGLALVARAQGDSETLAARSEEARAWAIEVGDSSSLHAAHSLELRLGALSENGSIGEQGPPPEDDHNSFWLEVPSVTHAMRMIVDESPEVVARSLPYVEATLARMRRHHNVQQATILSVLRALALDANGRHPEALTCLANTIREAEPFGLVRAFVDRGPRLQKLLVELSRTQEHDGYREMLHGQFLEEGRSIGPSAHVNGKSWEVLTFREIEVLELLAEHLTDKEIAMRLSVTPGAIKKRTHRIYQKLGAADRREAVARALAQGLLRSDR